MILIKNFCKKSNFFPEKNEKILIHFEFRNENLGEESTSPQKIILQKKKVFLRSKNDFFFSTECVKRENHTGYDIFHLVKKVRIFS